jgi:hypothetical protein
MFLISFQDFEGFLGKQVYNNLLVNIPSELKGPRSNIKNIRAESSLFLFNYLQTGL